MENKDYSMPRGYIDLIEQRYDLKVIDSHYILVNKKYQKYNVMLDVKFNDKMRVAFEQKYGKYSSMNHVAWEINEGKQSIRFFAEVGNNILLLWDSIAD